MEAMVGADPVEEILSVLETPDTGKMMSTDKSELLYIGKITFSRRLSQCPMEVITISTHSPPSNKRHI